MPNILPTDWDAAPSESIAERGRGRAFPDVRNDLVSKISSAEEEGLGAVPTSLIYAGALAATDDREAARWTALIARQLDLPAPPRRHQPTRAGRPRYRPEQRIDPYTGKAISLQRARQLFQIGAQVATVLEARKQLPKRAKYAPDPANVASIVSALGLVDDLPAERALAFAIDADRTNMPIERFRGNLSVIGAWNEESGAISDEEALIYARWWAENKDRPITRGDLVTITTPELTEAIQNKRGAINTNPYAKMPSAPNATPEQIAAGHELYYGEVEALVAARDKAIADPRYLEDARAILQEVESPDWADRAISWSAARIEDLWHVSQHAFVDVSTLGVGAYEIAKGALPGGGSIGDGIRETQKERQYIINRINGGDSVGTIYSEDSFLPTWAAPAFDFAVGWAFDPFILGGKLATGVRAGRAAPEILEAQTLAKRLGQAVTPQAVSDWWYRLRLNNYGGVILKFSRSKESRALMDAAYKADDGEEMFSLMARLANNVEARSALEYEYMTVARAELLQKYPVASEKAWAEWQEIMRGHFDVPVSEGSLAQRVNAIRNGTQVEFAEKALASPPQFILGRPVARETVDDIIRDGTSPLMLRDEVPHSLIPVPGFGAGKLAGMRFARSRLGQSDFGSSLRSVFNVNPGAVLRPGDNAELFFLRKGVRWRTFTESELRNFQVRAAEITSSGSAVNKRMAALLEEMDRTAMRRIGNRLGMSQEQVNKAVDQITFGARKLNDQTTFGVTKMGGVTRTEAFRPLTETHLANEIISLDPVLVRKAMRRYNSLFHELSRTAAKHGLPDAGAIAAATKDVSDDLLRGVMRTWKLMVVPRPAYIGRVILLDENLRFMSTTMSLMERLVSFELKKGIRGLVGKGASKLLDDTIRVGDRSIPLPRAGGFGYEPLANQAFHTEEALDDLLRHAGLRDRSLETLGHWGAIQPKDVQHPVFWMRALNFQLGNSVPGRIALASVSRNETLAETVGALKRWAERDGWTMLRSELGIEREMVDEWAEALAGMTHGYTMGNPALAAAANTRSITEDMLSVYRPVEGAVDARPVIHGPLVEALTGAGGHARNGFGLRRLTNRVWDTFVRTPENILNRQPYYRVWKRRATQAHLKALDAQGYERVTYVEVINREPVARLLSPGDAATLRAYAAMDRRSFMEVMEGDGRIIGPALDIREYPAGGGPRIPTEAAAGEVETFRLNAEAHGVPFRPGAVEPVSDPFGALPEGVVPFAAPEATDLGNGVWRYKYQQEVGKFTSSELTTYGVYDGDELQAFITVPRYQQLDVPGLAEEFRAEGFYPRLDTDSIMLRARADAPRDATARMAEAVMRDVGETESILELLYAPIPLTRKGALFVHRRIQDVAKANIESLERVAVVEKPLTPEILARVDQASREFALAQVKKIMFDFTENTRFGEMVSAVFPFFQPWAEAYQVWGHILLKRNPAMIGYVAQSWKLAEETGVVKRDENGQWVMPWSFFSRVYSMLPWLGGKELPEGLGMVAPLSSLNLFISNSVELGGFPVPVPGLAPWAAIPLKDLFRDTQNPYLISYLFSYGPETPLVSRWMENTARKWWPDEFHDERQEAVAMDFLRLYQYMGTDRDENGDPLPADVLKARAMEDARQVSGMLGVIGLVAPTTGRLTFPEGYEEKEDELDELRDNLGFEEGTDVFLARNPELTLMTVGKTITTRILDGETAPRLPQSEDVQQLFAEPGFARFAKRFPAWTAMLVLAQDSEWDESSLAVFADQIQDKAIEYKGLDRFYTDGQTAGFWNAIDAMYAHLNPRADRYEAEGLGDDNAKVQELATEKAEMLYHIYLRYPQYATKQGIRPNPYIDGQAIWDGDEGTPPSEIVLRQAQQITELDGFQEFPAVQGLKAYLDLRQQMQHKMEAIAVDDIGSSTSEKAGLTAEWEDGKASILETFPEVEPFINAFFDDDLEGLPSAAERKLLRMREKEPDEYERYLRTDTRLEHLADAALVQDSGDQRSVVYNNQAAYIDQLYDNGNAARLRLWFNRKDRSSQVSYVQAIQARPPVFYSQFDWELMGVKLTKNAAAILSSYRDAREEIDERSASEERGGPEFLSGNAYESVDRQMAAYARKDKSLAQALVAMRSFGYGLFNPLPEGSPGFSYVDQKGKAGYAWRYLAGVVKQVNDAIIDLGWHGPDSYDSDDDVRNYLATRDSLFDAVEEFMKWSPTFKDQWYEFQRTQLRGDPVIEWIMPDTYFPIGIVGED